MKKTFRPLIISTLLASTILPGCTPLVLGGAAATTLIISDRRSAGMQITDKTIGITIQNRVNAQLNKKTTHIYADSFNQRVLLTGEVATQADKNRVASIAKNVQDAKTVINEITVGPVASFSERSRDTWITSKVRSDLIFTKQVPSRTISITTSKGIVYLMGQVTQDEGNIAAQAVSKIDGVVKVVKVFDIITNAEAEALNKGRSTTANPDDNYKIHPKNQKTIQTKPLK